MDQDEIRRITFRVTTEGPLHAGEQVFVSGNSTALGDWAPDGLPLTRVDDSIWAGFIDLPVSDRVEFKFTRGLWENQAVDEDGALPRNQVIRSGRDDLTVNQFIGQWRDKVRAPADA